MTDTIVTIPVVRDAAGIAKRLPFLQSILNFQ